MTPTCSDDETAPPPGAAADWTVPPRRFTADEHRVWDLLFARQQARLAGRVVQGFADGIERLDLARPGIPDWEGLNDRLGACSGWTVVPVPGLVPDEVFFDHLANRRFPVGNFIRRRDRLDYLEQPDLFHDLFGHLPLLASPAIAGLMERFGRLGLAARARDQAERLARLYWHSVEFGLARESGELRICGAGLASSFGESRFALEDERPRRLGFDPAAMVRTPYRIDCFQPLYFVVDGIEAMAARLVAEAEALVLKGPGNLDEDAASNRCDPEKESRE